MVIRMVRCLRLASAPQRRAISRRLKITGSRFSCLGKGMCSTAQSGGSQSGTVYHDSGCRYYNCNCVKLFGSKQEAEREGYRGCKGHSVCCDRSDCDHGRHLTRRHLHSQAS